MNAADIPFLPRGVRVKECKIREGWFLLAPERAVKLDQVARILVKDPTSPAQP